MPSDVVTPIGSRVRALDLHLHATELGSGPPLVWLHGGGPGASGWSNFRGNAPEFPDFRNLVLDLPRFGRSEKPVIDEPLIPFMAARVAAALDALDVHRATVVGNSLGGGVAVRLAAERPDLVDRLVLMAAAGTIPAGWDGGMPEGLAAIDDVIRHGPSRERIERFTRLMVVDESLVTDELIDERLAAASDPEIVERNKGFEPVVGDNTPVLGDVRARALLLWGREDRFIPLEWALVALRGLPEAELRVVPHCGHWMQVEQRDLFNRTVRSVLEEAA